MTTQSVLGDRTAGAIRRAIDAAGRGRLHEACGFAEAALAEGGEPVALNALLGMLRCQAGDVDAGIGHLRIAHQAKPGDLKITANLVTALASLSRNQEAYELLNDELVRSDQTMRLERLRGFLAQAIEDFPTAVRSYENVVAAAPGDWEAWNNLGNARRCVGDFEGSIAALERAVRLEPNSPPIQLNLAIAHGAAGDYAEAEKRLRALALADPGEARPLRELHALLREQARDEEALEAIEEAVRREPTNVELLAGLGSHQSQMQQYAAAESAYQRAIACEPANGAANLGLATVYDLTNQLERLYAIQEEALARQVDESTLQFIRAFAFRRQKNYEAGLKAIDQVPEGLETSRRLHLYGQLLQGVGRHDEAFTAFERMNDLARDDVSRPEERATAFRSHVRQQLEALTPGYAASWQPRKPDSRANPAFLVGFPRSGTTLLDTILMGHDDVEVLEEEPTTRAAMRLIPDIGALPTLSDDKIAAARDAYWQTAQSLTPLSPGKLLIDKNPLLMNGLPFLHRLFPGAKIILALRHPCDVVLSCFITNFRSNDGMASFHRLDTAAELYDLSFSNFERAQALLEIPAHRIVYERIVADRERELRPLFDFLGLDWHDRVLAHEETAKGRGRIKTASYAQVVEPIYTRARGRWWNYRRQLEPILPILAPWVEKLGYSLDDPEKFPSGSDN